MRLYIAGPMRRRPRFNFDAFYAAERALRKRGHTVINPARHDREALGFDPLEHDPWAPLTDVFDLDAARAWDLAQITGHAEGVVLLDGWETSEGASLEYRVALDSGLPMWTVADIDVIPLDARPKATVAR